MDARLPIVTTPTRGIVDHLIDKENALFVPPREPQKLADAIVQLLTNTTLREEMAEANFKKVKEFAPESVAKRYLDTIINVIDGC